MGFITPTHVVLNATLVTLPLHMSACVVIGGIALADESFILILNVASFCRSQDIVFCCLELEREIRT